MKATRLFCAVLILTIGSLAQPVAEAASQRLNIPPVVQQTPVWCWAAAGEMALRHLNIPSINPIGNYQCGIVATLGSTCWNDCGLCITPIGSTYNLSNVLNNYQSITRQYGYKGRLFKTEPGQRMSFRELIDEIDAGRPVLAGISPSGMGKYYPQGMSEHVVVVVGYQNNGPVRQLLINDPMPYGKFGFDPYLQIGADRVQGGHYRISYDRFVNLLGYKDSIVFQ